MTARSWAGRSGVFGEGMSGRLVVAAVIAVTVALTIAPGVSMAQERAAAGPSSSAPTARPNTARLGTARPDTSDTAGAFVSVAPARVLDTRSGGGPLAPMAVRSVQVAGAAGVPSSGVSAVVVNVTVVGAGASGYVSAYADGAPRPQVSNVNFSRGETVPNFGGGAGGFGWEDRIVQWFYGRDGAVGGCGRLFLGWFADSAGGVCVGGSGAGVGYALWWWSVGGDGGAVGSGGWGGGGAVVGCVGGGGECDGGRCWGVWLCECVCRWCTAAAGVECEFLAG